MGKRILSFALVCVMMLGLLGISAFAAGTLNVSIESKTAKPGDDVTLTMQATGTGGNIGGMTFNIIPQAGLVDGNVKVTASVGDLSGSMNNAANGTVNWMEDTDDMSGYPSVTFTITFKVAADADGTYSLSYVDKGSLDPGYQAMTIADPQNATITITHDHTYGTTPTRWDWTGNDETGYTAASAVFACTAVEGCTEDKVLTAQVTSSGSEPTCTEGGTVTYTATASDSNGTYTDTKTVILAAAGHTWAVDTSVGENGWTWTKSGDTYTAAVAIKCSKCNATDTVNATVTKDTAASHDASCSEGGVAKFDASATIPGSETPVTASKTDETEALGHEWTINTAVGENGWTWTEVSGAGYTAVLNVVCSRDASHTDTIEATVTSESTGTCGETGNTTYTAKATLNGAEQTATKNVTGAVIEHDYGQPTWSWDEDYSKATATFTCSKCAATVEGHTITRETTPAESVITAATCEADGSSKYTATVKVNPTDEASFSDEKTVTTGKLGHAWALDTAAGENGWTYNNTNMTAKANFKCTHDGCTETQLVAATEKTKDNSNAPTCDAAGSVKIVFTATPESKTDKDTGVEAVDSAEKTFNIDALGHDYTEITINWTQNESTGAWSATAVAVCSRNSSHTTTAQVTVTPETTDATCTTDGSTVYTAVATYGEGQSALTKTESKTVEHTHDGHTWGEATFDWSQFNLATGEGTVTASRTCSSNAHDAAKDGANPEVVTAVVTSTGNAANCIEDSTRVWTATATFAGGTAADTATDSKNDTTTKLGHRFAEPTWTWNNDNTEATATFKCSACNAEIEVKDESPEAEVTKAATCAEVGAKTITASADVPESGKVGDGSKTTYETSKSAEIARLPHDFSAADAHRDEVGAKCEEDGTIEYWQCGGACAGKYRTNAVDQEPSAALADADLVISALGHDLKHYGLEEETCTEDGTKEYWECQREGCGKVFADADAEPTDLVEDPDTWKVIAATAHTGTVEHKDRREPDFENDGWKEHWYCSKCEEYFLENPEGKIDAETKDYDTDIKLPKLDILYGDVNADGEVGLADLMMLKRYCGELISSVPSLLNADVNGDGVVGLADLMMLKRYCGELIPYSALGPQS